jgi:UPF0755 protein
VHDLAGAGVVNHPLLFKIAGRILGDEGKIRSGKYSFESGISNLDLLCSMTEGRSFAHLSITFQEGIRSDQIAHLLQQEAGIDSAQFMKIVLDTSLIGIPGHDAVSLEGFLMPDTYEFSWQDDPRDAAGKMVKEFRAFFNDSLVRRCAELHCSIREVITVASIVEGETRVDSERSIVAGVYYNRLKKHMRLEADPTVRYLLPPGTRAVHYGDLDINSPYNTYRNYGLPPTPINNPGRSSILAALSPDHHQYLYFVADGNGGHRFARSFEDHLKNVRNYRKGRVAALNSQDGAKHSSSHR